MNNATHLDHQTDIKHKWYVKFNELNGIVIKVSARPINQPETFQPGVSIIETTNEIAGKIIQGTFPKKWARMVWDVILEEWKMSTETDVLHIQEIGIGIHKVVGKNPNNNDVYVRVFKDTNTVEVSVNIQNIKRSMNMGEISSISKNGDSLLNFYFCEKDNPDRLLQTVEIDPQLLISRKKLVFDIDQDIEWDSVSVFTRKLFTSYGIEYHQSKSELNNIFSGEQLLQRVTNAHINAHLTIVRDQENIKVLNNITEEKRYTIDSLKRIMFIVCDGHVDRPVGAFGIPGESLREQKPVDIKIKFDWPQRPVILYKSNTLLVNYLGEQHAQSR